MSKRGRTEQDYLAVTAEDTNWMHCTSSRATPYAIRPGTGPQATKGRYHVVDSTLGRSRVPQPDGPQPYTAIADRFAAEAADRADNIMRDAAALEHEEQREMQRRTMLRLARPEQRDPDHTASDHRRRYTTGAVMVTDPQVNRMQRQMEVNSYTGVQGGGVLPSRHYEAARSLYTSAAAADPSSVTYAAAAAGAALRSGDLQGALAKAKAMQELAVMPRLHPRVNIGVGA